MSLDVNEIHLLVAALQKASADRQTRGPLVGLVSDDGTLDLRIPPKEMVDSPHTFFCALQTGIRRADAVTVGVVLPVRSIWGDDQPCDYLDAEALILVAAHDAGSGVASVGLRCALHDLPSGWAEAHDDLQWLARPLRHAVAGRPTEETEAL